MRLTDFQLDDVLPVIGAVANVAEQDMMSVGSGTVQRIKRDLPTNHPLRVLAKRSTPSWANTTSMSGSSHCFKAARLWERTSAKGMRYMQGSVKLVIRSTAILHTLFFQNGSSTQPRPAGGCAS